MNLTKEMAIVLHTAIELSNLKPLGKDGRKVCSAPSIISTTIPRLPRTRHSSRSSRSFSAAPPKVGALYGYALAQLVAKAYQKAGKVDKEKFITAMEGLTVDSPVGKLEMRACDHQLTLPMFFGVTKASPQYDYLIAGDLITIPGKDYMPGCDEVVKSRK